MSKNLRSILLIFAAFTAILQFFTVAVGQNIEATIKIGQNSGSVAQISGKTVVKGRNLSFLRSIAGAENIAERVSEVRLYDDEGKTVTYRKFAAGEYIADVDFVSWSYRVNLAPPQNRNAAAHISWLTDRIGIFMLGDLLPQFAAKDARITLDLPPRWQAFSQSRKWPENVVETPELSRSVIFVGKDLVQMSVATPRKLELIFDGEWNFTLGEAAAAAKEIFVEYSRLFGTPPAQDQMYAAVLRFPHSTPVGNWEAETRGATITILSSDMPFKSQSIQRLHEQLRHEMFHLWLPNGVNLSGQYDWFYEGFALYRSLKLGVAVNRIRFDDFLDTLSRAYDIDRLSADNISLIDASKIRWSGANTRVYARGMLVAFLSDVSMLDASKGKRSADDLLREIYEKHRMPAAATDGNAAILTVMRSRKELVPIVERYILGGEQLDLAALLQKAGIEANTRDQLTRLVVVRKPSGKQKELLNKLGYNSWRKLASDK